MPMPHALLVKNLSFCFSIIKRLPLNHHTTTAPTSTDQADSDSDDYEEMITTAATPDLSNVYASNRFFFSSPGRSNSIVESLSVSEEEEEEEEDEGVAVEKYSDDPYSDFRRSMEQMVVARGINGEDGESWKSLQELFNCYLSLNPKHTHKFIVAAFSDLLLSLLAARKFALS